MPIAPATVVPLRPPAPPPPPPPPAAVAVLGFAPPTDADAAKEASPLPPPLPGVANPVEERRFRILSATEPGEEGVIGVMAADTVTVGGGGVFGGGGGAVSIFSAAAADIVLRRLRTLSATAPGEEEVMEGETATAGEVADDGPEAAVADMPLEKWTMHLAVFAGFVSH